MDIKEKIDELTEQEAKAALMWYAEKTAKWLSCRDCPDISPCRASFKTDMPKMCMDRLFALALKEAQE